MLNITRQWQDPEILIFFAIRVYYEKLGLILKPPMSKFRSDLSVCLRNIAEKQVPAKLKPIIVNYESDEQLPQNYRQSRITQEAFVF